MEGTSSTASGAGGALGTGGNASTTASTTGAGGAGPTTLAAWDFTSGLDGLSMSGGTNESFANGIVSYSFTSTGSNAFELSEMGPNNGFDWTGAVSVTARVRASAGITWAKVYVQTGAGWQWHDAGVYTASDLESWSDITYTFSGDDLTTVKKFGLQAGGAGTFTVDVDYIHVQ